MNDTSIWKIRIDTGGTFTDCIAVDPQGSSTRVKILSKGGIRGKIIRKINPHVYQFEAPWNYESRLLENFHFTVLQSHEESTLLAINYEDKTLTVENNLTSLIGKSFELSTGEPAPVLAARLATRTPLKEVFPPLEMRLGTTKGTNALLEKKGAKTLMLVTKGFKDLFRIGTQQRPELFQLAIPEPELLYDQIVEVDERMDADGNVVRSATLPELQGKFDSVGVSLLHSHRNASHEEELGRYLRQNGFESVSISSSLFNSSHYLRRSQTALINAYLSPLLDNYLAGIQKALGNGRLLIMSSDGGLVDASHFRAKDSLLSGPAAGAIAASFLARKTGMHRVITFDMGGTSTDAARIDETPELKYITRIGQFEFHNPSLAIETVAAGGGSVCWFDGFSIQVGPESAGASPGPACYGNGGPLTITDVNLLLGKLDASNFAIPINTNAAESRLKVIKNEIFERTGNFLSLRHILEGFERVANEKMADAIRKISIAKGINPADYGLLVFGGAGGMHGCQLADILNVQRVILPYDAGLFSASGMEHARLQKITGRQILQPWRDAAPHLNEIRSELYEQGKRQLEEQGVVNTTIGFQSVYLRFKGQESSIEVPYSEKNTLLHFEQAYRTQFGYFPDNLEIELESFRLSVKESEPEMEVGMILQNGMPVAAKKSLQPPVMDENAPETVSVYNWPELQPGEFIAGPAVILNPTSTSYLPEHWSAIVQHDLTLIASRPLPAEAAVVHATEAELELFTNRFRSIAEEMGIQLQRTAFSVNVRERLDFSCALLDDEGELLVNAPHIPVHLGSLGVCTRLVRESIAIEPGDVIITNHPKYGGSHLPDVTLIAGVFDHNSVLRGYVVNRAHHAEIGGKTPGSMPTDAVTLEEEGVCIVPQYLVRGGELQLKSIQKLFEGAPYPTRSYRENEADILAALSALRKGQSQLLELISEFGADKVKTYMNLLKQKAAVQLKAALMPWFDQTLKATEYLDDGHRINAVITISASELHFDFTGTSRVHPNNLNANISILYSAILYVLRLIVNKEIPLNEGLTKNVRITLPDNSFLHPDFHDNANLCPAVVGGNTEVSQRLVDTLVKAFGLAACSQGTMNNFLFGDDTFGYYETIGGGTGAGRNFNGRSGVHQHMTNTRITDPEELERKYPVRLLEFGIRTKSGGKGKFKGGDGIVRTFEFLRPLDATFIGQHHYFSPYGSAGGDHGESGNVFLSNGSEKPTLLPGIFSIKLKKGDVLRIETPGGGGYGEKE